jgi:2-oxo-4-hydroxy-4-carboxy--5-ureidoimidazoline (OHCU) decarboxylase
MSETLTGARVVFRVNGQKVAFAQSISYSVQHNHQQVDVIDQLEPAEYAETGYIVNFTVTQFRVPFQSAISTGLRPKLQNILSQPELTAD